MLALANVVSEPLRQAPAGAEPGPAVGELRAGPAGAEPGDVRVALLPDVAAELDWMADAIAEHWAAHRGQTPPTSAVLVRRRVDMDPIATALRARGLPVEVVGLGGLLDTPEVRDLVSRAARWSPTRWPGRPRCACSPGPAGGSGWPTWPRSGPAPARSSRRRRPARARAPPPSWPWARCPGSTPSRPGWSTPSTTPARRRTTRPAGFARIRRLARELGWLRSRGSAPLTDLVADAERVLLLDAETAARPGPVGRAHLDAFADVVAEFATGAEVATLPALLDFLETAERAEDGLTPGEVEVAPNRVQVLTVHAAKGLEWQVVAVPHLVTGVFPGRKIGGTWLTSPAELPVPLRGDAADLPGFALPDGGDRKQLEEAVKQHSEALDERRLTEERRLCYVALTRAERVLLVSGHRWGAVGDRPREPSPYLVELAQVHPPQVWAGEVDEPGPGRRRTADRALAGRPAGERSAAVHAGAELVQAALRELDEQRAARAEAAEPGAQLELLDLAAEPPSRTERPGGRRRGDEERPRRAGPPTSRCCWPSGPRPGSGRPSRCRPSCR